MPVWNYLWKVFCILCHDIWSWYSQILAQFSTDLFLNKATIYEILKFPLCLSWGYVTWEVMKSFIICLKYVHFFKWTFIEHLPARSCVWHWKHQWTKQKIFLFPRCIIQGRQGYPDSKQEYMHKGMMEGNVLISFYIYFLFSFLHLSLYFS